MSKIAYSFTALLVAVLLACTTAPLTGRKQLMLVSEGQEVGMGEEAYRHELRNNVLCRDPECVRIVRKVGERIAQAASKPEYKWEFSVINDPEMINAFALPGGKVAVYTGIFGPARDEAGLAVVLGHEVAHAVLRHPGERITQMQLVGAGLALAGAAGINPQLLQALGLGASVGVILPFGRRQESEADRVGLTLMAKAGYDPRVSLDLWERMEKTEKGRGSPPEFLSTHPSYETRTQQLREFMPEALAHYRPDGRPIEPLPSPQTLDIPLARAERELIKRIRTINQQAGSAERAVVEALAYTFRVDPSVVVRERQELGLDYGNYAAIRAASQLGRAPAKRVLSDFQNLLSWPEIAERNGTRLSELISFMDQLTRTTASIHSRLRNQPAPQRFRPR